MTLHPPLKRGVTTTGNVIWIKNWDDMHRCRSQKFGENLVSFYKDLGLKGHNGEDYVLLRGEDIYPMHDGFVQKINNDQSAGVGVYIMSHDKAYRTVYWHMKKDSVVVKVGQNVKTSNKLGKGNNSGMSTADHLHTGLKLYKNGLLLNSKNGYWGSVNPDPYKSLLTMELTWIQIQQLYRVVFHREADEDARGYVGKTLEFVVSELQGSDEWYIYDKLFTAGKEIEKFGKSQ